MTSDPAGSGNRAKATVPRGGLPLHTADPIRNRGVTTSTRQPLQLNYTWVPDSDLITRGAYASRRTVAA
jgi:hypothetical protein